MSAPNFHPPSPGLTVGEIATLTGAVPQRDIARDRRITGLAPLDRAGPGDLSFLDRATHAGDAETTDAGVCLTIERFAAHLPPHVGMMFVKQPYRAFVEVACKLYPDALRPSTLFEGSGTVPGTFVHPTARLEAGVRIDPGVVIGARAEIGAGTVIAPAAVIGLDVRIGRDCAIGTNATVTHSLIGDRVILHPGARIGQDGFGFVPGPGGMRKVPQLGRVIIQDDVEIGANSTIDRGSIRDTIIGEGTKIDNLVQIAHNVVIGRYCLLAGLAGVSGSVTVGDFVMMGGSAGVTDNVIVGEGAQIGARASVMSNIPAGGRWLGTPARPARAYLREVAVVKRLVEESRLVDRPDGPHNDPATDDPT